MAIAKNDHRSLMDDHRMAQICLIGWNANVCTPVPEKCKRLHTYFLSAHFIQGED
jgi:hypothetical protein